MPARPSAGIGVVEVQKLKVCVFYTALRDCGDRRGRVAKTRGFFRNFCCSNWLLGVVSWFARLLPGPAGRGFDSPLVCGVTFKNESSTRSPLPQLELENRKF